MEGDKCEFSTHLCLPFCTTLLRDGKGPFPGGACRYPVEWRVTSGAQSMQGIVFLFVSKKATNKRAIQTSQIQVLGNYLLRI